MKFSKKYSQGVLCLIVLISGGLVFSRYFLKENQKEENVIKTEKEIVLLDEEKENSIDNENLSDKNKLHIISNKCIGCGKCVRIAPRNFFFDRNSHKAEVLSQKDTESILVKEAKDRCPTDAIVL